MRMKPSLNIDIVQSNSVRIPTDLNNLPFVSSRFALTFGSTIKFIHQQIHSLLNLTKVL